MAAISNDCTKSTVAKQRKLGNMQIVSGKPYPLGATWDGLGVNFAIFSEHGTKVELCLFDSPESTQEKPSESYCQNKMAMSGTVT